MGAQASEERWSYNSPHRSLKQGRVNHNRLGFMLLSIVIHGSLLSLWIITSHHPTSYFREMEEQIARPSSTASQMPHWRATVDCSIFSIDCFVRGRVSNQYKQYPFPPTDTNGFQIKKITEIPPKWIEEVITLLNNN